MAPLSHDPSHPVMRRVLIIGSGGAGKSTLANRLGALLKIEVLHLDKLYWQAGWVEPSKAEWLKRVEELIRRDSWIMDGNYGGTLDVRLSACDTVIFLDLPRTLCLWRIVKRAIVYRNSSRPDMAAGCNERLTLEFALWVWNYSKRTKPKVLRMLESKQDTKRVLRLLSQAEVERFLAEVESSTLRLNSQPQQRCFQD